MMDSFPNNSYCGHLKLSDINTIHINLIDQMNSEFEWQYTFDLIYNLLEAIWHTWLDTGISVL